MDDAIRLKVKAVRARKPEHLPTVLSRDEVRGILDTMSGVQKLMAQLLYGTGMRLRVRVVARQGHRLRSA
ncbi:MAG: hypothetical protein HZY76_11160 [Anaerolineae bacterium]|nr:MAG: hypothetical protein HZY76_11160 [Anaerolineae bacterium]